MNTSLSPRTYRVEEAAQLLGVGRNQFYEALKRGDFPCIRVGKRLLIPRAALDRLLDGEAAPPPRAA
jgi:excisionase family DNA binding protein